VTRLRRDVLRHFGSSAWLALAGLVLAALYGWHETHAVVATLAMLWTVAVLAVLEISLSFDNAVVNAAVLTEMEPIWQRRFLTWGMVFAVFGMRIAFPLAIVGFAAGLDPVAVVRLSLSDPVRYAAILSHAHIAIAGFGGAFLTLVGLNFFIDPDKTLHWLGWAERRMQLMVHIKAGEIAVVLLAVVAIARSLPDAGAMQFLVAGVLGVAAFIAIEGLGSVMEDYEARHAATGLVVRAGLGAFIYLNVLDASFSLDGVIGAFALTQNMVIIAIGLSIGAIFVRSLTVMMVENSTLTEYRFLEHGAFWAILALGAIMLASALVEVPETVTGLIGALLIGAALWWSMRRSG
jgi:hypothetical protein